MFYFSNDGSGWRVGKLGDRTEEYRSKIFIIVQDHAGEKPATAFVCTSFRRCDSRG
jgi:hypothetical protein